MEKSRKIMEKSRGKKSRENQGKITQKSGGNHGKIKGKSQKNQAKIVGKNHRKIREKSGENHGKIRGKSWKNQGKGEMPAATGTDLETLNKGNTVLASSRPQFHGALGRDRKGGDS